MEIRINIFDWLYNKGMENVLKILPVLIEELDNNTLSDETALQIKQIPEEEISNLTKLNFPLSLIFKYVQGMVLSSDKRAGIVEDLKADLHILREDAVI